VKGGVSDDWWCSIVSPPTIPWTAAQFERMARAPNRYRKRELQKLAAPIFSHPQPQPLHIVPVPTRSTQ
jgi:hypothetical protein